MLMQLLRNSVLGQLSCREPGYGHFTSLEDIPFATVIRVLFFFCILHMYIKWLFYIKFQRD